MRITRLSLKDKQKLKYLLQTDTKTPVTETDESGEVEYIEIDGEQVPVETGYYDVGHVQTPAEKDKIINFTGNIAFSGGETHVEEYGINPSDYDAILIMPKNSLPITETSYIWHTGNVKYTDEQQTRVDTSSADYKVVKVVPSLGVVKYLLRAVVN